MQLASWAPAALLTLLLLAPACTAATTPTPPPSPPIASIQQPRYAVGDTWTYRIVSIQGSQTSAPLDQTLRVGAFELLGNVSVIRLDATSFLRIPGNSTSPTITTSSRTSTWLTQVGLKVLRTEGQDEKVEDSSDPPYIVTTRVQVNWTFHQPLDSFQFPILGPGGGTAGESWIVLTNATVEQTRASTTMVKGGQPRNLTPQVEVQNMSSSHVTSWLRQDRVTVPAGTFDGVILLTQDPNGTSHDFWSPAVGNFARQEVYDPYGNLVRAASLVSYRFQDAPNLPGTGSGWVEALFFSQPWLPFAWAAVAGIGIALAALRIGPRLRGRRPGASPPAEPAPLDPPSSSGGTPPPDGTGARAAADAAPPDTLPPGAGPPDARHRP